MIMVVKGIVPTIISVKIEQFFFNKKVEISLNIN